MQIWARTTSASCSPLGQQQNGITVAVAWQRQAQSRNAKGVRVHGDRIAAASALPATASSQNATAAGSLNAAAKLLLQINQNQRFTIVKLIEHSSLESVIA